MTTLELTRAQKRRSLERADYRYGYLLIAPMLIGFTMFVFIPIIATVALSFYDYNLLLRYAFCWIQKLCPAVYE